ncbi:DUF6308 family protein [Williamsia sterculiae]|uniref:Uncharacterized protein n=1 Tax=Williamsia sterculiae TaxID=1344003 RepID=A0A1N7HAZ0_9NOCA|nr:DUF6308 family protein [Williamsia sterculiae]SIS21992.1 hypothetical protein SAMN05445060_3858 [Williamsia sterculiae]
MAASWTLPEPLLPGHEPAAVDLLQRYFGTVSNGDPAYTGSRFERFARGGDLPEIKNQIVPSDLVSVTLLSVKVPGSAALRLLGDHPTEHPQKISLLLEKLPTNVELVSATDEHLVDANELWQRVRRGCKVGPTTTSKLLARKRPHLLPVIDSVVSTELNHNNRRLDFYREMRRILNADDRALYRRLQQMRGAAGVGDDISIIRVFDVVVWMYGSDQQRPRVPRTPAQTTHDDQGARSR